jgi:hypothetical protein
VTGRHARRCQDQQGQGIAPKALTSDSNRAARKRAAAVLERSRGWRSGLCGTARQLLPMTGLKELQHTLDEVEGQEQDQR